MMSFARRSLACLALIVGTSLLDPSAGRAQQPVFHGAGDTVQVFVTVTDRDGRLVTSLTQTDFDVRDNGRPQPIVIFDNQPQPIQLIVMLDVSGSMQGNLELLRASADRLFDSLLPGDQARVGTFGSDIVISPAFTGDRVTLLSALPNHIEPDAPTPLWRAIDEAIAGFRDEAGGRRVVLVLSDGRDGSSLGIGGRRVSQAEVIDAARQRDVMIYAIGMRSRGPRALTPSVEPQAPSSRLAVDMPDAGLARVAQHTGGGYVELRRE